MYTTLVYTTLVYTTLVYTTLVYTLHSCVHCVKLTCVHYIYSYTCLHSVKNFVYILYTKLVHTSLVYTTHVHNVLISKLNIEHDVLNVHCTLSTTSDSHCTLDSGVVYSVYKRCKKYALFVCKVSTNSE